MFVLQLHSTTYILLSTTSNQTSSHTTQSIIQTTSNNIKKTKNINNKLKNSKINLIMTGVFKNASTTGGISIHTFPLTIIYTKYIPHFHSQPQQKQQIKQQIKQQNL